MLATEMPSAGMTVVENDDASYSGVCDACGYRSKGQRTRNLALQMLRQHDASPRHRARLCGRARAPRRPPIAA